MKPFFFVVLSLLMAAMQLSGCASAGDPTASKPLACPEPARLEQASSLTTFLPGRVDVAAQIMTAQITGVAGSCTLERKAHVVQFKFQVGFEAQNGPANAFRPVTAPYFVAITNGDAIVQENFYTITLSFDGNSNTTETSSKPIIVDVPEDLSRADLQILVGFKLTSQQLKQEVAF